MIRVSNGLIKNNLIFSMKRNYKNMRSSQTRLATGRRHEIPGQAPIRAINSIYYRIFFHITLNRKGLFQAILK